MNSLIINTANKRLDIVLSLGSTNFLLSANEGAKHNESLIPLIDTFLKQHNLTLKDINKFGVVVGPGSFTGIRVGVATIKAFRDVNNVKAYGINNLDLLYNLAKNQFTDFGAVAIAGSGNTYFVAKLIHDVVYKFDRNLTKQELIEVSENKPIAMFEQDENLNSLVVNMDANIMLKCLEDSFNNTLTPVYYQLSQAEREKLKQGVLQIEKANENLIEDIFNLEQTIATSPLNKQQIIEAYNSLDYKILVAKFNNQMVGFIILQVSDEVNIVSIAVKKEFQNLGIGTKLLNNAVEVCKTLNKNLLSLEVGYKNIKAFLLYKKFGFAVRRTRKKYYKNGDDCLEMIKEV